MGTRRAAPAAPLQQGTGSARPLVQDPSTSAKIPCVYFPAWQAVLRDQKCTLTSGNLRASVVKPKPAPSEGRKICSSLGKMDIT